MSTSPGREDSAGMAVLERWGLDDVRPMETRGIVRPPAAPIFLISTRGRGWRFQAISIQPAAEKQVQNETLGCSGEHYGQFVRLPYSAALLWPLAQLPFGVALLVWRCLLVAAVAGASCGCGRDRVGTLWRCAPGRFR